jgi:hypothetical protein
LVSPCSAAQARVWPSSVSIARRRHVGSGRPRRGRGRSRPAVGRAVGGAAVVEQRPGQRIGDQPFPHRPCTARASSTGRCTTASHNARPFSTSSRPCSHAASVAGSTSRNCTACPSRASAVILVSDRASPISSGAHRLVLCNRCEIPAPRSSARRRRANSASSTDCRAPAQEISFPNPAIASISSASGQRGRIAGGGVQLQCEEPGRGSGSDRWRLAPGRCPLRVAGGVLGVLAQQIGDLGAQLVEGHVPSGILDQSCEHVFDISAVSCSYQGFGRGSPARDAPPQRSRLPVPNR